jgi:ABC-type Zn2+ transport system substrate-binding protein/surface adhesin
MRSDMTELTDSEPGPEVVARIVAELSAPKVLPIDPVEFAGRQLAYLQREEARIARDNANRLRREEAARQERERQALLRWHEQRERQRRESQVKAAADQERQQRARLARIKAERNAEKQAAAMAQQQQRQQAALQQRWQTISELDQQITEQNAPVIEPTLYEPFSFDPIQPSATPDRRGYNQPGGRWQYRGGSS